MYFKCFYENKEVLEKIYEQAEKFAKEGFIFNNDDDEYSEAELSFYLALKRLIEEMW